MAVTSQLLALTAEGGIPLFARKVGDIESLPFPTIGALNGVHMFSTLRGSELKNVITSDGRILWRAYHDSIVLIVITRNDACGDLHLANLLDNVFASLVLLVGLDSLCNHTNVERFKRELKVCYGIIDYLLAQIDQDLATVGDLTQTVDTLLSYESQSLQGYLEKFLEVADSTYGCLLARGKIVIASKKWWTLIPQELVLISAFINSLPKSTSRDIPVYLPCSCPRVCNRLLTLKLVQGVELCVLCGATPSLTHLEEEAPKIWKGSFDLLKIVSSLHPRNFPSNIILDRTILGVLLIHTELNQSMCSVQPFDDDSIHLNEGKFANLLSRQEALRTLYKIVIGNFIGENNSELETNSSSVQNHCQAQEMYICSDQHKFYVVRSPPYQLFLVFDKSIPTYALRSVAHKTLKSLTVKKLFPQ